mgnify:FL=1
MRIRSIEASDREFFIDRCHAFYKTPACDHEIPQQNAERTFELLLHGTPYADCLIAEDENGQPCAYCLLALTWSNEAGGLCVWLEEIMVDDERRGKGIGSGKLGTPTLNQNYPAAALQPCAGVYLTRIYLDGQWRPAATGIGKRPTVDSSENAAVTCETFVPDFSGNVYGQQPVLEFHKYFCPVRKFNSMDELAALIHHAADESKAYFAALNGAK